MLLAQRYCDPGVTLAVKSARYKNQGMAVAPLTVGGGIQHGACEGALFWDSESQAPRSLLPWPTGRSFESALTAAIA